MSGKKITGKFFLCLLITSSILVASCKKNREDYGTPAVIQLLNVMDDGIILKVNYSGQHPVRYNRTLDLWNKEYQQFNTITMDQLPQTLALYSYEDTLDKDRPLIDAPLDIEKGNSYSFFALGSKTEPDFLLNKDEHTAGNMSDSLTFIRIVNLVKGLTISVNLKDDPVGSIEQEIAFKELSPFKGYAAGRSVTGHVFEIRDHTTGNLILSFPITDINETNITKNTWLNRTNSLVLTGQLNGAGLNEPKIVRIPHFL